MGKHYSPGSKNSQQGAVLIVSLLILLIMTIMGVSAMQSSTLEEKMASNERDRNVAFQSAEVGMRQAQTYIDSLATTGGFTDANGLYSSISTEPDPFLAATWDSANAANYRTGNAPGNSAGVQYFISRVGTVKESDSLEIPPSVVNEVTIFRIVARGQGASGSEVLLRSYYGRKM